MVARLYLGPVSMTNGQSEDMSWMWMLLAFEGGSGGLVRGFEEPLQYRSITLHRNITTGIDTLVVMFLLKTTRESWISM